MTAARRRWAVLIAVVLACVLPLGSAQAAQSRDNTATAVIEQDGGSAFDFAWDISRDWKATSITNHNSATALARCVECEATAIAFQIVLYSGSPNPFVPINTAEAVNTECTNCTVVAAARQFVYQFDGPVRFTGTGRAILSDVRDRLAALESADLPVDQLYTEIETQEARVRYVLGNEVVLRGKPSKEADVLKRRTLQVNAR